MNNDTESDLIAKMREQYEHLKNDFSEEERQKMVNAKSLTELWEIYTKRI